MRQATKQNIAGIAKTVQPVLLPNSQFGVSKSMPVSNEKNLCVIVLQLANDNMTKKQNKFQLHDSYVAATAFSPRHFKFRDKSNRTIPILPVKRQPKNLQIGPRKQ